MGDEAREVLLEKECPGCKIDGVKQEQRGVPYIHLSFIWLVSLCTALPISSLFPYLYFMIKDFHIAKQEEDIGFYAGFVASSFMIGRALTSIFWGKLADRYGRKPIIFIGTFSVIIFNTLFGLSTSFWVAISFRFLLGCFNCLLGVIRAYASEIVSEEYQALSLSVVSTSRGIGLILGPAIGGYLAQPAEKYPDMFSQSSVFGRFPYFLPSLVISVYATGVLIACWWLPETLHTHCRIAHERHNPVNNDDGVLDDQSKESLFTNRPLMAIIIVYCVFFPPRDSLLRDILTLGCQRQKLWRIEFLISRRWPSFSYIRIWASGVSTFNIPAVGEDPRTPFGYTSFCSNVDTATFLLPLCSFAFWCNPPFRDKLCIHLEKRFLYLTCHRTFYPAEQGRASESERCC